MQGMVGLLVTRLFSVPHFFDYRKQPSFSLHDLSWVPMDRFKQLLIRERRECETRKKQSRAAMGQCPASPSKDAQNTIFELFCRHWNPLQVGEFMVCCPQACKLGLVKPENVDSYLPYHQPIRKMSMSLLGEAHWLKLLTLARHHLNELFYDRRSW